MTVGQLVGRGNTAEVFQWGENEVFKLFFETTPVKDIEREFEISRLIHQLKIPSPNVSEIIEYQNRIGIIYEKVNGNSFTQQLSAKPYLLKRNGRYFAELQASFHEKSSDELPSQKAYISRNISGTDLLTQQEKDLIINYLSRLPEGNKICHGDYHTDNIILANGSAKILDWMTGTVGNPCGDVARTLIIMRYAFLPPTMPRTTKLLIQVFRNLFTKFYINSYMKLTSTSIEDIEKWQLPVMAARLIEGIPKPEKEILLKIIRNSLKESHSLK
ncbi:phosphotransferase family protein [Pseudoneobacillus rhizosphaerae]|uniref:Aminoglycoside phosphotransferase domain-containing protein n=1 Tax=Pseudoneobacillus rhizosphaerae TaxID=2880968 RepID=A0A9C7GDF2_9BACI|nr:phosphotransferase [Pseudoneobacillus rhizosphaerae]CAG9610135.1 hypothetical protein NEOCIP111885_03881 [Pseudoneobacillus rhizosphaerae]